MSETNNMSPKELDGIRISISEMLDDGMIADIGADHDDLAVCVTRICAELRHTYEVVAATRQTSIEAMRRIRTLVGATDADDEPAEHFVAKAVSENAKLRDQNQRLFDALSAYVNADDWDASLEQNAIEAMAFSMQPPAPRS